MDIHLHLCVVTKLAEGKEHWLHMPERLCCVNHQTQVGKWIQLWNDHSTDEWKLCKQSVRHQYVPRRRGGMQL